MRSGGEGLDGDFYVVRILLIYVIAAELLWDRLHCLRQCLEYATLLNSDLCSYNCYPYDKAKTHSEQVRL